MGEEAKQLEESNPEEKKEEKAEEKKEEKTEEKPSEDGKEEPKPPSPFVLFVDLHCVGCAKKIEKSIMKIKGVERVVIDMAQNQVTIKGIVEPQAVCTKIMKKSRRKARVLSPLPAAEGDPMPEVVTSQVSGLTTVELSVDMHCQACAGQLKRKILKMRGVQTAVTEISAGKVTVTGTMDANKLVDYVYRRTKKQARIVPQAEPEKQDKMEAEKPAEEAKAEEIKEENPDVEKKEASKPTEEAKKEEDEKEGDKNNENDEKKEEKEDETKAKEGEGENNNVNEEEEGLKRMIYYYQPLYVIERMPPPPQLFSDENPNACCVS